MPKYTYRLGCTRDIWNQTRYIDSSNAGAILSEINLDSLSNGLETLTIKHGEEFLSNVVNARSLNLTYYLLLDYNTKDTLSYILSTESELYFSVRLDNKELRRCTCRLADVKFCTEEGSFYKGVYQKVQIKLMLLDPYFYQTLQTSGTSTQYYNDNGVLTTIGSPDSSGYYIINTYLDTDDSPLVITFTNNTGSTITGTSSSIKEWCVNATSYIPCGVANIDLTGYTFSNGMVLTYDSETNTFSRAGTPMEGVISPNSDILRFTPRRSRFQFTGFNNWTIAVGGKFRYKSILI